MYFKLLNICLIMFDGMGVNPRKGYTIPQVFIYILTISSHCTIFYLSILSLVYKENITMTDVTNASETLFLMCHAMIKCTILFIKRKKIRDLLERMDHFWKIEDVKDESERKEHLQYLNFIKIAFFVYTLMCICTTISFTCKGLFIKGDYLTFNAYKPQWIPFPVMLVYELIVFVVGVYFPIPGLDKFMLTMLLLTKMQFKLLNQEMERTFNEMANSEEKSEHFDNKIKRIVDYHDFLLDYVKRISNIFSEGMLVYIIVIVMSMCIQMYVVSTQSSVKALIKALLYMTNGIVQYAFCYCVPAQAISDEADKATQYAYFSRWYDNPSSTKVAQLMIIGRSQKRTFILAGGHIKVDLETCLKTIKTMVSYAMFIRTMGIGQDI